MLIEQETSTAPPILIVGKPLDWKVVLAAPRVRFWDPDSSSCFYLEGQDGTHCRLTARASESSVSLKAVDGTPLLFEAKVVEDERVGRRVMEVTAFLKLPIFTNVPDAPERIEGVPSGSALIRSAWHFLHRHHPDLAGIKAQLEAPRDSDERSDNYLAYTKATANGMSTEEAASQTPTGKHAKQLLGEEHEIKVFPLLSAPTPTVVAYFLKAA